MAVQRGSGDGYLEASSLGLTSGGAFTFMGWFKSVGNSSWTTIISLDEDDQNEDYRYIADDQGMTTAGVWSDDDGASPGIDPDLDLDDNGWYFLCVVIDANGDGQFWYKADGDSGLTDGGSTTGWSDTDDIDHIFIGESPWGGEDWYGSFIAVKLFDEDLTQTEVETEMDEQAAQKRTNLIGEWYLNDHTDLTDSSGNGNDLSGGSGTSEDTSNPTDLTLASGGTEYQRTFTGASTPTSSLAAEIAHGLAGASTPTSSLAAAVATALAGVTTPTGAAIKRTAAAYTGTTTPTSTLATIRAAMLAIAGAIAPTSTLAAAVANQLAGTSTPTGDITEHNPATSHTGDVTPIGIHTRKTGTTYTGSTTPTGTLATGLAYLRTFLGSITPTGATASRIATALSGATAPIGAATQKAATALAGTTTPAATLISKVRTALAGSTTPTGAGTFDKIIGLITRTFTGTTTPTGALTSRPGIIPTGATTPTGALIQQVATALAGATAPAGALLAKIRTALAGTITPTGDGTFQKILGLIQRTFTGATTPTSSLASRAKTNPDGATTPTSTLTSRIATAVAGATAPAGNLTKLVSTAMAGTLGAAGSLATEHIIGLITRTFTGAITAAGTLGLRIFHRLEGTTVPTGTAVKDVTTTAYTGTTIPTGTHTAQPKLTHTGEIVPQSTLTHTIRTVFAGTLTPAAQLAKTVATALSGSLTASGALATRLPGAAPLVAVARRIRRGARDRSIGSARASTMRRDQRTHIDRKDYDV